MGQLITIYYIATSNYKMGFRHFMLNAKCLYPHIPKKVIVLSDGLTEWDGYREDNIAYEVHYIQHFSWPIITLFKMKYILDYWDDEADYVFYFNGNLQYNAQYNLPIPSKLYVSTHCMGNAEDCYDGDRFAHVVEQSTGYIPAQYKYIHGGLFFGPANIVKKMCKEVCRMCEMDLAHNIIPQWHDETYLNKWCCDNSDLVVKEALISYGDFCADKPFAIIETIKKDRKIGKVYLPTPLGRFGNRMYEIMAALTYGNKYHKDVLVGNDFLPKSICLEIENYDARNTPKSTLVQYGGEGDIEIPQIDEDCVFYGYFQNVNIIDIDYCKTIIKCPKEVDEVIRQKYPDVEKCVSLHCRRGDYLSKENKDVYNVLTTKYIYKVINKYYKNEKIICLSDDIEWCKQHLSHPNIVFSDSEDYMVDFWIQTKTKANICSCSSFSCMGALLNNNKDCVVPTPYYKNSDYDLMVPKWAKREKI